jgi:hypothetical protein
MIVPKLSQLVKKKALKTGKFNTKIQPLKFLVIYFIMILYPIMITLPKYIPLMTSEIGAESLYGHELSINLSYANSLKN